MTAVRTGDTESSCAAQRLSLFRIIWPRRQRVLSETQKFKSALPDDLLTRYMPAGDPHNISARVINKSKALDDLGLRKVDGSDFQSAMYFADIYGVTPEF